MRRINARSSRPVTNLRTRMERFEGKTPEQALNEVGGLFCPEVREIQTLDGINCEGWRAIVNPNNNRVLGIGSDGYQPMDCKIVSDTVSRLSETLKRLPKITNAFCTGGGRLVGLEAQIGDGTSIIPGDDVVPVIKVFQGNGGNAPLKFLFEVSRLICSNGMRAPVAGLSHVFTCKHTKHIEARYDWNFDHVLKNFEEAEVDILSAFKKFAEMPLDTHGAEAYFKQIAKARKDEGEKADQTVLSLFEVYNHPRQTICGNTVWRAFNAATEYLQYYGFRNDESMLLENLDGKAVQWKEAAFQLALEIAA